jgi:DNA-binding transcriptional LysR family regulator
MDTKKLDLNLLVALEALLAERNVTKAAGRLNLSQPALSAQLNRLRDVFGDPLLIPAQRGMIATARALELQQPLHAALEQVRGVVVAQSPFDPATAHLTFSLAASDYIQYAVLMPLVLLLRHEAPGIRIAWHGIDGRTVGRQMEQGDIDLGFITPHMAPDALRARKLFDETYVCIARRNHPRIKRKLDLATFGALEHIVVSPRGGGFSGATDQALETLGYTRRVGLSIASFLMAPELVARSDMIALVPKRLVSGRAEALQILEPPLMVPGFAISLIWHDRTTTHAAMRWLRERVVALVSARPTNTKNLGNGRKRRAPHD